MGSFLEPNPGLNRDTERNPIPHVSTCGCLLVGKINPSPIHYNAPRVFDPSPLTGCENNHKMLRESGAQLLLVKWESIALLCIELLFQYSPLVQTLFMRSLTIKNTLQTPQMSKLWDLSGNVLAFLWKTPSRSGWVLRFWVNLQ